MGVAQEGMEVKSLGNIVLSLNWKNKNTKQQRGLPVKYGFIPNE